MDRVSNFVRFPQGELKFKFTLFRSRVVRTAFCEVCHPVDAVAKILRSKDRVVKINGVSTTAQFHGVMVSVTEPGKVHVKS